jgi:hypothetical protein
MVVSREMCEMDLALALGDASAAARHTREVTPVLRSLGTVPDLLVMGTSAVESDDEALLTGIIELAALSGSVGRSVSWQADTLRGALEVMRGGLDGLARIDEACDGFRSMGVRFSLGLALMCRVLVAPTAIGAAEAAEEARAILGGLGAVTLLRGPLADPIVPDTARPAAPTAPSGG